MKVISKTGNYIISSSFGQSVVEGTSSIGSDGAIITFSIDQINPIYKSFYHTITPITGTYGDFWDDFWSNRFGGEPANEFATSGFGTSFSLKINPDKIYEQNQQFKVNFYLSVLDQSYGVPPVASATFTILDDDGVTLKGKATADALNGTAKPDTLYGQAGNDVLDGKAGIDAMYGGTGNDTFYVDNTGDRVFEKAGQGKDVVLSSTSFALLAGQEIETLQFTKSAGNAALNLTGNEFAQTIIGNAGNNTLDGGGGNDALRGGAGNDTYVVDSTRDRVFEASGQGKDTVISSVSYALAAGQEIETLQLAKSTGTKALKLFGNEFVNSLIGNDGANMLIGGGGSDVLTGRGGADTFVFDTKPGAGNIDRITDFSHAADTIQLHKSMFASLGKGGLSATAFKDAGVKGAVIDADDRVIYDHRDGVLYYDANGSGTGGRTLVAILDNKAVIDHTDFFIV